MPNDPRPAPGRALPEAGELAKRPMDDLAPVVARWSHAMALSVGPMATAEMLRDLADDIEKAFRDAGVTDHGR
ncbi:MAG: hypothetical protein MUF73_06910 [Rhodobacteraceae bacterium]|jgi:hypothetical protein|nr:hypothetical protein [Paracoccaceae bacterium]